MQVTNFDFSIEEKEALKEQRFFQLKNSATKKIVELFGELERNLKKQVSAYHFPVEELNTKTGKIFRGENYKMYPYVVLDYPKLFSTQSVFAFRTMFWWGHEFSFTLHLQGSALDHYRENLRKNWNSFSGHDFYVCVNSTPWQYNFSKENYVPIEDLSFRKEELLSAPFIKLSRKISVSEIEAVPEYCYRTFEMLMKALH